MAFYVYDEDGSNRRENITDWALAHFRSHYADPAITKWDIFHYTYAVLHHPVYRTRYAANLKRELPRIPLAPDFHAFARAGRRLSELHVDYEKQAGFPLQRVESKDAAVSFRVEKMKLSKDKTQLVYNDFLTLAGIPPSVYEYKLGNRSALEWVVDQYQVFTDPRSGIENDPNRLEDEQYILRLIGQVITVSLETMQIVGALPDLGLDRAQGAGTAPAAPGAADAEDGKPLKKKRKLGGWEGQITMSADFDAPLDDLADAFEGIGVGGEAREPDAPYGGKPAPGRKRRS